MGAKSPTLTGVRPHPRGNAIEIDFDYRGRRCRPTLPLSPTPPNLRAAAKLRQQVIEDIHLGSFDLRLAFPDYAEKIGIVASDSPSFGECADAWLQSKSRLGQSTLDEYRRTLKFHWLTHFEHTPIAEIKKKNIIAVMSVLVVADKTYNNILIPVRGAFGEAVANKFISRDDNPCDQIENLDPQTEDPDPFLANEVAQIVKGLLDLYGQPMADFYEFAFVTGLRPSEQLGLHWTEIDWNARTMLVKQAMVRGNLQNRTKTKRQRHVSLTRRAIEILHRQKLQSFLAGDEVFLDPSTLRPWWGIKGPVKRWDRALKKEGIRYRSPKQTRHTRATAMLEAGLPESLIAAELGHSTEVLRKHYAKWIDPVRKRSLIDRMDEAVTASSPLEAQVS